MITFSKIGKKGNLGNQLFQIASTIGLATKNNREFAFLLWKYQNSFKNQLPLLQADFKDFVNLDEENYHCYEWNFENKNYDITGWLQTEKYFDSNLTKHYFEFSDSLKDKIERLYQKAFEKRTILISIRRGDFVHHKDYFQTPINYYLNSLATFFPDWNSSNLIILSDDINYCKFHFSFLENAFFGDGLNEIEQLCLGTMCDDFIIGNSTFSWWTAWLGEKKDSKIIRPLKNFDGEKSKILNDKDYYPERWTRYNHLDQKIQFTDLAFVINSEKNTEELKTYLTNYFHAEIILKENDFQSQKNSYFINKDYFLPPLLIYFSYLKLKNSDINLIVNNEINVFAVSKTLNYDEFDLQKDFGFFSRIFSFSKHKNINKNDSKDIYLKRNIQFTDESFNENEVVIDFSAGRFLNVGGYNFSFKRFVKRKENDLKRTIKKILKIKK